MKTNTVLFEATVMDSFKSDVTDPPSEVINLNYEVEPCDVYDVTYNEQTEEVEKNLAYIDNKGWIQMRIPIFNGLKPGDKIQVIKL